MARQNWIGAQEIAESIRRIDSSGGMADQILGTALIGRNKYDEAIAAFQNAYNAAPTAAQPMDSLVGALLKANRKDQATIIPEIGADERSRITQMPLCSWARYSFRAAPPIRPSRAFWQPSRRNRKIVVGYRALADFYVSQKNYDEAIKIVRSGIEQQPDTLALHMILASVLERKGDYESAISEYEFMLDRQPANLILANNLASLLLDHRTDEASLKKAQSLAAILRKSEIPQFKDTLGWASYRQGDYRTAVALSEEASAALPDQAAIRYHLGMGYIATDQTRQSIGAAQKGAGTGSRQRAGGGNTHGA